MVKKNYSIHLGLSILMAQFCVFFPTYAEEDCALYKESYENVQYNCEIVLPVDFNEDELYRGKVNATYCSDYSKALDVLVQDKTIVEEQIYPAEGDIPEWRYYTLEDGTVLGTGDTTFFTTINSYYYEKAFKNIVLEESTDVEQFDFMTVVECEKNLNDLLKAIDLNADIAFKNYALNYEIASAWEEHLAHDGTYDTEGYKQNWSEEDNAYLIYGYQEFQNLPVYHELMFLGGNMKYLNADNAVLQAIYTCGGLQKLQVNYLYDFEIMEEKVKLKSFQEIVNTINLRLNGTIENTMYEVKKAVLMQMVKHNQVQGYDVLPVWYVEAESQEGITVILVNAETAEEIFIR